MQAAAQRRWVNATVNLWTRTFGTAPDTATAFTALAPGGSGPELPMARASNNQKSDVWFQARSSERAGEICDRKSQGGDVTLPLETLAGFPIFRAAERHLNPAEMGSGVMELIFDIVLLVVAGSALASLPALGRLVET